MKKFLLPVLALFLFYVQTFSQVISINEARNKSEGTTVTVRGIVLNGEELGVIRYLQDPTGGIGLYDTDLSNLKRGDSVEVTGKISPYNELMEIASVSNFNVISSNNNLPKPTELTFTEGFSEKYECQLVKFRNVEFTTSGTFSGATNYSVKQNTTTGEVRIDNSTNITGTEIPKNKITIIGIMSQYKTTYQLMPRDLGDLGFINSRISVSDIKTNSFRLHYNTLEEGQTIIRYGITTSLEMGEKKDPQLVKNHEIELDGLFPAKFYYVQALSVNATLDTIKSGLFYFSTASESSGDIKVYFNRPVDNSYSLIDDATWLNRSIDDTLVAYIKRAQQTIDMAIYNLNNDGLSAGISSALNTAANRGVRVRVIYEGSNANKGINGLSSSVKVFESPQGSNYKIMHNKFLVFDADSDPDQAIVWTGSTNLTDGQIHEDPNNVIIIQDQALARAYVKEFEEMWGSPGFQPNAMNSKFGKFKSDNTPHIFNVGGKIVECYFSPSDNVNSKIIDIIKTADVDIYFATMVFTRTSMAYPMLDRHDDGVYVAGMFDDISGSSAAAYNVLKPELDTNILVYSNPGILHHKYAIIDQSVHYSDPVLITGSHNWSYSADNSNDENTLFIHDQAIANIFFQEWAKRFADEGGTVYVGQEEKEDISEQDIKAVIINNDLRLFYESDRQQQGIISLYNLNGAKVFEQKINLSSGNNIVDINVPRLNNNIYILKLNTGKHVKTLKLFRY